jgi:hypothetical protein
MMIEPSALAMVTLRARVQEGKAELLIPSELEKSKSKKVTERQVYNPAESVPIEVAGGANRIEKAIVEGSTFGGCKLVGTQETLPEDEFHAIAEVTQDSTTDGFLYFLLEDTVDIITAIAEGTTPRLEHPFQKADWNGFF